MNDVFVAIGIFALLVMFIGVVVFRHTSKGVYDRIESYDEPWPGYNDHTDPDRDIYNLHDEADDED